MTRKLPHGLKNRDAAAILGMTPSTLSRATTGKTARPTHGLAMLIWLWPRLSKRMQAALLASEHHHPQDDVIP